MKGGVFESRPLSETIEADVCVVGAGFSGLTAAYCLARAGRSVALLEGSEISGGESARSTAHLSTALSMRYSRLEDIHGPPAARLIAESHAAAIDFIEKTIAEEGIACDFARLNGYLFWPADGDLSELDEELAACERAGLPAEKTASAPLPFWDTGPCLRFARQAQLNPVRYLSGLARAATRRGVRIFTRSRARLLPGEPLRLRTAGGAVNARSVVLATNAPMGDRIAISSRQAAYRTYALAAALPLGTFPEPILLWDTVEPYHYARLGLPGLLMVGGEDHKVGHAVDAAERWQRLEAWARQRFPMLGEVTHRWSGQVQEAIDGLAYIGRRPREKRPVYMITGDCGSGTTHGTLGGHLVADLILGRRNDWAEVYDPARLQVHSAFEFAKGALDAAAQYLRYAAPGDAASVDQIPPGCGAVLRRGLTPLAVFRESDGTLVERSAVCPHLGGLVCWNQAERTWDCPVHGSRFSPRGDVLSGPSNEPLGAPHKSLPLPETPAPRAWTPPPSSP